MKIFVVMKIYTHIAFTENLKAFMTEQEAVNFIYEKMCDPSMENFPTDKPIFRFQEVELSA